MVKGADFLVKGSSSLANRLGVSKLTIGLTIVAVGTTLPELMVSVFALADSTGEIVFGNILGSCITNLLLTLGILAFLTRLRVKNSTTWKEIPFAFLAALALAAFAMRPIFDPGTTDNFLFRTDGLLLLLFLAIFLYYAFELGKKSREPLSPTVIKGRSGKTIALMISAGVAGLYLGGEWTVQGATFAAESMGLSKFLVSATVVAIGTSLPELTTSIVAASKNHIDIAVGNIIGANILNIFWVLGLSSIINPIPYPTFMKADTIILLTATFALFIFMFTSRKHELDRWEGGLFLAGYAAYITFLIVRG